MPKSKRNKLVSLTKVKKRGFEAKEVLLESVQAACDKFKYAYVLSFDNMRSVPFKHMQSDLHGQVKFFLGKNKVMMKALGVSPESEYQDNTARLSKYLTGQVCLAFTDSEPKAFEKTLAKYEVDEFAQAGAEAPFDVFLAEGKEALDGYCHSMEPLLRELGLPTRLHM